MSVIDAIIAKKLCGGSSSGGGGPVPKPLTYDYMPEGYPSKSVQTTTLMEEQELAFALTGDSGQYGGQLTGAFEVVVGQTYTVNWDGTEYECVCSTFNSFPFIGNLSILSMSDSNDTGEPFLYYNNGNMGGFGTFDTSASHTVSVTAVMEVIIPMSEDSLPTAAKNTTVFYV